MKMRSTVLFVAMCLILLSTSIRGADPAPNQAPPAPTNEADQLDLIVLHSFEHFDYLDILYKLKGHNADTWICLFYKDEDHHKEHRDNIKRLIFKDNPTFKYVEANISKPNYSPITQAIRFPQNAKNEDYPMILIMKNQVGQMVYGPGVARKARDIVDAIKAKEEEDRKKAEAAKAAKTT